MVSNKKGIDSDHELHLNTIRKGVSKILLIHNMTTVSQVFFLEKHNTVCY